MPGTEQMEWATPGITPIENGPRMLQLVLRSRLVQSRLSVSVTAVVVTLILQLDNPLGGHSRQSLGLFISNAAGIRADDAPAANRYQQ